APYCAGVYRQLAARRADLPASAHLALERMAREDWLGSYAGLEGIADVLARMGRRARQPNPLAGAEVEFVADPAGFAQDFADWLPDARRFVAEWLDGRGRIGPVGGA
ncbi:acyl carrier protein phosphodiesterase, partial [uncultured Amaricoccus sp.]